MSNIIFKSWPDINQFYQINKFAEKYPNLVPNKIEYLPKIKLHGTNAAIRIKGNDIAAQSRSNIITPDNDNAGFAKWVEENKEYFSTLNNKFEDYTIFGEWCGKGIQKGVAISQIPNKIFAVFAIIVHVNEDQSNDLMYVQPELLKHLIPNPIPNLYILPWHNQNPTIVNYYNNEQLKNVADVMTEEVNNVEKSDPWVKSTFNVDGIGEGLVYYPILDSDKRQDFSNLSFKVKGEKHKVEKNKVIVPIDPELAENCNKFVEQFLTENRLEQGLSNVTLDISNVGAFLKWISQDILKESADVLTQSNLEWKQVNQQIQNAARIWFIKKVKSL